MTRFVTCEACEGTGEIVLGRPLWDDPYYVVEEPCPDCNGSGWVEGEEEPIELEDWEAYFEPRAV